MAVAIDSVLAHKHHRIRTRSSVTARRPRCAPSICSVMLDLFLVILKCGHGSSPACCNTVRAPFGVRPDIVLHTSKLRAYPEVCNLWRAYTCCGCRCSKILLRVWNLAFSTNFTLWGTRPISRMTYEPLYERFEVLGSDAPVSAYNLSGQDSSPGDRPELFSFELTKKKQW